MLTLEVLNYEKEIEETITLEAIVSQPIDSIVYSKYLSDKDIPLVYFESSEVNSNSNLHFSKTHWKVPSNNENLYDNLTYRFYSKTFTLPFKDVLITTTSTINKQGYDTPLFYKHKRKVKEAAAYYIELGETIQIDEGFKIENDYFYCNYENVFNENTFSYKIFFISGVDLNDQSFNELLNLEPAFNKASWKDIDLETGLLIGNVYEVNQEGENYIYNLRLEQSCSDVTNYYVLPINTNIIKLLKPESISIYSPWLPRITNGVCFDKNTYKVVDYEMQPFNPIYGVIKLHNKSAYRVSNNLIKLSVNKLKIDPVELLNIEVYIYDSEHNILKVLTTNKQLIGTKYSSTDIVYTSGISSWDEYYGFVELEQTITNDQLIEASFFYETDSFIYNEVNLNPFQNEKVLHNKYYFYLINNTDLSITRHLHHLLVDENNRIIESSQFPLLINEDLNPNTFVSKNLNEFKSIYIYTESTPNNSYMELGEISYNDNAYIDETMTFDYQREYELNHTYYKKLLNRNWKILQSRYGYGKQGQFFQENNLLFLEVPIKLLNNYGGTYTEEEIDTLLRRKLPAGRDIIIDYIYPKSLLTVNNDVPKEITIDFTWEEPGTYYLERSINVDFSKKEIIYIVESNSLTSLSYKDIDLETGKLYYYSVRINNHLSSNQIGVQVR